MSAFIDTSAWVDRLRPLIAERVEGINAAITNHPEVQQWLQNRAASAALSARSEADLMVLNSLYADMLFDFRREFRTLVEAVHAVTQGAATVEISWDPLAPHLSRAHLRFDAPIPVNAIRVLEDVDAEVIGQHIQTLCGMLPSTEPFPGHPHTLGAVLVRESRTLPLQIIDAVKDNFRMTTVRLLPRDLSVKGHLSPPEATSAVAEYFQIARREL